MPYSNPEKQKAASASSFQRRREKWAAAGLCRQCGRRPPAPDRAKCEKCLQRHQLSARRAARAAKQSPHLEVPAVAPDVQEVAAAANVKTAERVATKGSGTASVVHERIAELAGDGKVAREIAQILGRHPNTIRRVASQHGIKLPPDDHGRKVRNMDDIRELADQGLSRSEIADRIGLSRARIHQLCQRHGIKARTVRRRNYPPPKHLDEVRKLADEGFSRTVIAERVGYSRSRIDQICMKYAIRTHGAGTVAKPRPVARMAPIPKPSPGPLSEPRVMVPCAICETRRVRIDPKMLAGYPPNGLWPQCKRCQKRIAEIAAGIKSAAKAKETAAMEVVAEGW